MTIFGNKSWRRRLRRSVNCAALLSLIHAGLVHADGLSDIYRQLQEQPQNVALNLRYASEAEKVGKLKWALPAYERVLVADPGNKDALAGIDRIRTRLRTETGAE